MGNRKAQNLIIALVCLTSGIAFAQGANAQIGKSKTVKEVDGPAMDSIEIETPGDAQTALDHYMPYLKELEAKHSRYEGRTNLSAREKKDVSDLKNQIADMKSEIQKMKDLIAKFKKSERPGVARASGLKPIGVTTESSEPRYQLPSDIYEGAKQEAARSAKAGRASSN